MSRSIRIFLSSSLFAVLMTSCGYYTFKGSVKENGTSFTNPYFQDEHQDYLYKADISAFKNHLSGIFVVKKTGQKNYRLALVSDLGNTLLDFELEGKKVTVHYVIDDLNRKIIVNKLKKYFQLLINPKYPVRKYKKDETGVVYLSKLQGKRVFLYLDHSGKLKEIRQASFFGNKAEIYFYGNAAQADSIYFDSKELPVEMRFRKR